MHTHIHRHTHTHILLSLSLSPDMRCGTLVCASDVYVCAYRMTKHDNLHENNCTLFLYGPLG